MIGRAAEYQGGGAEENVDYGRHIEGVAGDIAKFFMNRVEEIGDGPKKQNDRDVQERVYPVYEPPQGKAFK